MWWALFLISKRVFTDFTKGQLKILYVSCLGFWKKKWKRGFFLFIIFYFFNGCHMIFSCVFPIYKTAKWQKFLNSSIFFFFYKVWWALLLYDKIKIDRSKIFLIFILCMIEFWYLQMHSQLPCFPKWCYEFESHVFHAGQYWQILYTYQPTLAQENLLDCNEGPLTFSYM